MRISRTALSVGHLDAAASILNALASVQACLYRADNTLSRALDAIREDALRCALQVLDAHFHHEVDAASPDPIVYDCAHLLAEFSRVVGCSAARLFRSILLEDERRFVLLSKCCRVTPLENKGSSLLKWCVTILRNATFCMCRRCLHMDRIDAKIANILRGIDVQSVDQALLDSIQKGFVHDPFAEKDFCLSSGI
jgi:hypothetical protein